MAEFQHYSDPLIDEVRDRRRAVYADCGHDLRKLFEAIQSLQAQHPERVFDHRKPRPRPSRQET